jgi:hypothetical protein
MPRQASPAASCRSCRTLGRTKPGPQPAVASSKPIHNSPASTCLTQLQMARPHQFATMLRTYQRTWSSWSWCSLRQLLTSLPSILSSSRQALSTSSRFSLASLAVLASILLHSKQHAGQAAASDSMSQQRAFSRTHLGNGGYRTFPHSWLRVALCSQLVVGGFRGRQMRPNPSIERTCHGGLRPPRHAAHVERWASQ